MFWPVPESYCRRLPRPGEPGSFWEDRGDRHHAGVDIYAPGTASVVSIEDATVVAVHEFTSPDLNPYWNVTYSILTRNEQGLYLRYAELGSVCVEAGQKVRAGEVIGTVGSVLALDRIDSTAPLYIQRLKDRGNAAMLHFEMYDRQPRPLPPTLYLGGNYFQQEMPPGLLNPAKYLARAIDNSNDN